MKDVSKGNIKHCFLSLSSLSVVRIPYVYIRIMFTVCSQNIILFINRSVGIELRTVKELGEHPYCLQFLFHQHQPLKRSICSENIISQICKSVLSFRDSYKKCFHWQVLETVFWKHYIERRPSTAGRSFSVRVGADLEYGNWQPYLFVVKTREVGSKMFRLIHRPIRVTVLRLWSLHVLEAAKGSSQ